MIDSKLEPYVKVPYDKLPSQINKLVHLSWAFPKCRWHLKSIDGDFVNLETEVKPKKQLRAAY